MSPLYLRVVAGFEDARLLEHIGFLTSIRRSANEEALLVACYARLDDVTRPNTEARQPT